MEDAFQRGLKVSNLGHRAYTPEEVPRVLISMRTPLPIKSKLIDCHHVTRRLANALSFPKLPEGFACWGFGKRSDVTFFSPTPKSPRGGSPEKAGGS
ncbi:hypothetical protein ZHAS_00014755 [Anopheles sinensis]|uniref:Uncharacterized protein n=1 Tax=Anopheles sinensis TaxID=74873 RepID=A0A084W960_ANOSI|nr:hypothetical protein ZHAS_00014755 [Anopheles sinensis]